MDGTLSAQKFIYSVSQAYEVHLSLISFLFPIPSIPIPGSLFPVP